VTRDSSRKLIWGGTGLIAAAGIVAAAATWHSGRTPAPRQRPDGPAAKTSPAPSHAQTEAPSFDVVRVDPEGHAVLAGRAPPQSEVTVLNGDREIGRTAAGDDGDWMLVPDLPLPPGKSQLTLRSTTKSGTMTRSDGVVAMLVPERAAATPKREAPIAVLVPKEGAAAGLQLPPLGKGDRQLSLDIIEYGTHGDVIFAGRAAPGAQIGAYLNGRKMGDATAGPDGKWHIVTGDKVPPGRYRLKLESRNEAGKRVAQLAMSFERAAVPEQIPGGHVIVQPGNSLWRIARRSYGDGRRYVEIYEANHGQIGNPQLIFPGQLLEVPSKS